MSKLRKNINRSTPFKPYKVKSHFRTVDPKTEVSQFVPWYDTETGKTELIQIIHDRNPSAQELAGNKFWERLEKHRKVMEKAGTLRNPSANAWVLPEGGKLEDEYRLITEKKSNLSAMQRSKVIVAKLYGPNGKPNGNS